MPSSGTGNALANNPYNGTSVSSPGISGESNTGPGVSGQSIGLVPAGDTVGGLSPHPMVCLGRE